MSGDGALAGGRRERPWGGVAIGLGVLAAAVALLELTHPLHLHAGGASAGVETAVALSALTSAVLLVGCFRHGRRLSDLLLLGAVGTLFVSDLAFSTVPALGDVHRPVAGIGARLTMDALAALAFVVAAAGPRGPTGEHLGRRLGIVVLALLATVAVGEALGLITGLGAIGTLSPARARAIAGGAVPTVVTVGCSAAFALAGLWFLARDDRAAPEAAPLAGASFLLAAAQLEYLAAPALAPSSLSPGSGLRLLAYALLLAASLLSYRRHRRAAVEAALLDERERIARDLHDGLAQDLALIALHAQTLPATVGADHPLAIAARSALAKSRAVIADLSAAHEPTAELALRRVADELSRRYGVTVLVHVGAAALLPEPSPVEREHLVRIAREAIINAAVHGRARLVDVILERTAGALRLRVQDDGAGIALSGAAAGGFGLPAMHARAQALGGHLTIRRRGDGGTEVELVVP